MHSVMGRDLPSFWVIYFPTDLYQKNQIIDWAFMILHLWLVCLISLQLSFFFSAEK